MQELIFWGIVVLMVVPILAVGLSDRIANRVGRFRWLIPSLAVFLAAGFLLPQELREIRSLAVFVGALSTALVVFALCVRGINWARDKVLAELGKGSDQKQG